MLHVVRFFLTKERFMATEYFVKCPHASCQWSGSLPANPDDDYLRGASVNVSIVAFQCRRCLQIWRARLIGDDMEILPLEPDDGSTLSWPELDLGVGD